MSRRRGLWITGVASGVLLLVLALIDRELTATGGPGIVPFEAAGSTDRANEILAEWGEDGRDWARVSLWLDFPYLVAYTTFFVLAVSALRDAARDRGWQRYAAAGSAIAIAAVAGGLFDAIEDIGLLLVVGGDADTAAPRIATAFAIAKFLSIGLTALYLLGGLAALVRERLRDRRPASPDSPA